MWNWQEVAAQKYSREQIIDDMLKDDSLVFDMSKEDVIKILQKTNFNFVVRNMNFDDIYPLAISVTKKQLKKLLNSNKGFLKCEDFCTDKNKELIKRVIQRIANNTKNLFDDRYRTCIKKDLRTINYDSDTVNEIDALTILILEEDKKEEIKVSKLAQNQHLKFIRNNIKLEKNGQMFLILA